MPTLEEFFEEAIEQADPENMVENKYKYVNLCCVSLHLDLFHVWISKRKQTVLCITNICAGLESCTKNA